MNSLEQMVNNHADSVREAAKTKRICKHLYKATKATIVALAFLLFESMGLVSDVLAVPVMLIASMAAFYYLGRCGRF